MEGRAGQGLALRTVWSVGGCQIPGLLPKDEGWRLDRDGDRTPVPWEGSHPPLKASSLHSPAEVTLQLCGPKGLAGSWQPQAGQGGWNWAVGVK